MAEIDFVAQCDNCGRELDARVEVDSYHRRFKINVELCESCTDKADSAGYERGHDEGHEEGYDEGHGEGYDEGYDAGFSDGIDSEPETVDETTRDRQNAGDRQ